MSTKSKKLITTISWLIIVGALAIGGSQFFQHKQYYPSTDDAYLDADVISVASQVAGPVKKVHIGSNRRITAGAPILEVDQRPFNYELEKAQAQYELALQKMSIDTNGIKLAQARLTQAKAKLEAEEKYYNRIMTLVNKEQASLSNGDEAKVRFDVAKSALKQAQSQLAQAQQALGKKGIDNAQVRQAKAALDSAKLALEYTKPTSPKAGMVTSVGVAEGETVATGSTIMKLVLDDDWTIKANFKETQLQRIKPGQAVKIKVDMYPGHEFHGIVDSISIGSGAAFSLLPPENATGNWVKVTQRFPVKIKVQDPDPNFPLRVGASTTVTVDTTEG